MGSPEAQQAYTIIWYMRKAASQINRGRMDGFLLIYKDLIH